MGFGFVVGCGLGFGLRALGLGKCSGSSRLGFCSFLLWGMVESEGFGEGNDYLDRTRKEVES
jgi:hypothetical protein